MKLKYKLLRRFKWLRKVNYWYLMTFHRKRTLKNFRQILEETIKEND